MPIAPSRRTLALLGALCLAAASSRADSAALTVTPCATADSVHIQTHLTGTSPESVVLTGRIAEWKTGQELWSGSLGQGPDTTLDHLHPHLWSPGSPTLYVLTVTAQRAGSVLATASARFGFRSVAVQNGRIYLNGKPVFLRGLAINPPGRTIPDSTGLSRPFAEDYVRFMRSRNFNLIRMNLAFKPGVGQAWFDACDEQGMLVLEGDYGRPPGAESERDPPADFERAIGTYESVFAGYLPHPSVIGYILANELPYPTGSIPAWHAFLSKAYVRLKAWDSTRLFIGNAGYGLGLEGDIDDVHRYWGWYYNTFLTYYNLRDPALFGNPRLDQPVTFSECVGSFTGPTGEFNDVPTKQLLAQQQWTGTSGTQRDDALAYQAFMAKQAAESFRRMREVNPRLSGLLPFTILFYNWNGISSFHQMGAKPAADSMAIAYQPVLLSWELWTPQVYAGTRIHAIAHVINDAEDNSTLEGAELEYRIVAKDGAVLTRGRAAIASTPYYGTWRRICEIDLPSDAATGDYRLEGAVLRGGKSLSHNEAPLFIAGADWRRNQPPSSSPVLLFDPSGKTAAALATLGVKSAPLSDLNVLPAPGPVIVIGADAWNDAAAADLSALKTFVANGGRVVCLGQRHGRFNDAWLPSPIHLCDTSANDPTYLRRKRPTYDQMYINPERPDHPVLAGLDRTRLRLWSDYTGWDQHQAGFPRIYPVTHGFTLVKSDALACTAVIADYDRGLEGMALCEMFSGKGSVLLSAFDLVPRIGLDPVADRLLGNILRYAADPQRHDVHPLVTAPIHWGDYPTQQGIVLGPLSGLYLGTQWLPPVTNPHARPQRIGAWNTMPGDQMVPRGVRPRGPYVYGTSSTAVDEDPEDPNGEGFYWVALPAGKTRMVTQVRNPGTHRAQFQIEINGAKGAPAVDLAPGQSTTVRTPLSGDSRNVCVRYRGGRDLVVLETDFQ